MWTTKESVQTSVQRLKDEKLEWDKLVPCAGYCHHLGCQPSSPPTNLILGIVMDFIRRYLHWKNHENSQWTLNKKLQLQRLAYEQAR